MLRRMVLTAGLLSLMLVVAGAQDQKLSAYDFALDPEPYVGQRVTLTGCWFGAATFDTVLCGVQSKTGMVGNVIVDVASMGKEDRRFLTTECAGMLTEEVCVRDISGVVRKVLDDIQLFDGVIEQ